MKSTLLAISLILAMTSPAFADDSANDSEPKLRGDEQCFPFGGAVKQFNKFSNLKPEKRDTVGLAPAAKLTVKEEGEAYPERLFIRDNGVETDLIIDADGHVTNFGLIFEASEDVSLCAYDPSRAGTPVEDDSISFSMDMDIQYLENTGYHDLATLKDGLKDGKSHYKKMAGAMSFMVPKMSYVMIAYDAEDTPAQFKAVKDGIEIDVPTPDLFCDEPMISIETLEDMGADGLKVMGGTYKLMPTPSPKMLAKFARCSDDEPAEE